MDQRHKQAIIILTILILGGGYYFMGSQKDDASGNFRIGETNLTVEIADEFAEQYQGLSGRESMCKNCGMLFVYKDPKIQYFVMRGMRFPLDFVFVSRGVVVEIVENVPAPSHGQNPTFVTSSVEADMVIEVNAGFVRANYIKVGDPVRLNN